MLLCAVHFGIRVRWLGKKESFRGPLAPLLRRLGGHPDRSRRRPGPGGPHRGRVSRPRRAGAGPRARRHARLPRLLEVGLLPHRAGRRTSRWCCPSWTGERGGPASAPRCGSAATCGRTWSRSAPSTRACGRATRTRPRASACSRRTRPAEEAPAAGGEPARGRRPFARPARRRRVAARGLRRGRDRRAKARRQARAALEREPAEGVRGSGGVRRRRHGERPAAAAGRAAAAPGRVPGRHRQRPRARAGHDGELGWTCARCCCAGGPSPWTSSA